MHKSVSWQIVPSELGKMMISGWASLICATAADRCRYTHRRGDATLAGFVWGLSRSVPPEEALRLGVASGTASASLPGTAVAGRELVDKIAPLVQVNPISIR